ncbi:MAG: site-specific integrase [Ruminococcus sp.]|nr:site-specific integrase [Ruminococcus sp.]
MNRLKIEHRKITFEEGCELYLLDCKQRNLRQGTINHYTQSIKQFWNYFDYKLPLSEINEDLYNGYVVYLKSKFSNDMSINAYLRDLITIIHFLQRQDLVKSFTMQSIKVDKAPIETYTNEELEKLLYKPNIKKCTFLEYEAWVISCLLFSTGIRQHSLMELQVKDVDFDNSLLNVRVTKNRKPLIIPLNQSMLATLSEFLQYRQYRNKDDWLFCNVYGNKLLKSTSYRILYQYNKNRQVETTGLHRYRHTFAKQWVINGGNVVVLSRLLGHSSLAITQNYINLLVSDMAKQVDEINLLDKFSNRKFLKMTKNKPK